VLAAVEVPPEQYSIAPAPIASTTPPNIPNNAPENPLKVDSSVPINSLKKMLNLLSTQQYSEKKQY
jgi:hypothetical protein